MLPVVFLKSDVLSSQVAHWPSAETTEADFISHDPNRSPCRAVRQDADLLSALQGILLSPSVSFDFPRQAEERDPRGETS